jgi:CorA-like Mg2+ transporter protein
MAAKNSSQKVSDKYYERIMQFCPREACDIPLWPGFTALREFMTSEQVCTKPPGISIVNIPWEKDYTSQLPIILPEDPFLGELPSLADATPSSQLIIVENICPKTLATLGGTYDIDPQFFAEHINILSWYRMDEKVPERLPSLPSTKKREDFLVIKYVETREIELSDDASIAESVLWPDPSETRIRQSAGKLEPVSKPGKTFPRMAFTRQTVSIWCQKKTSGNGWVGKNSNIRLILSYLIFIAIMLLDPPFQLTKAHGRVGKAEYRNPSLRPKVGETFSGDENERAFRQAFCHLLEQKCSVDRMYLATCTTDVFLVFYECYRIIASEWLVVNEYVKRELASIEHHLEKSKSTFRELEQHLRELYRIRRRCNKDRELVAEAATQCKKRGQVLWPSSKSIPHGDANTIAFTERHAQELEEDLQYVIDNMNISISRIEKNITLLMALVTISEGRQGLQENRGIAFLTFMATIFLPFETVSSILGIQTQYGPGASGFWMLWAVSLPLTMLVIAIPYLYPTVRAKLNLLWERYSHYANAKKAARKLRDEGVELYNDQMPQMRQTSIYGVV